MYSLTFVQIAPSSQLKQNLIDIDTHNAKRFKAKNAFDSALYLYITLIKEPRCEKTGLRGFRLGLTQTRLNSHRRWLEACNFIFRKKRDCTIYVAKTKALIDQLCGYREADLRLCFRICIKKTFSHDAAQKILVFFSLNNLLP